MRDFLPKPLISLAEAVRNKTGKPLYLVGGCVRDFLAGFPLASSDFDLCAPVPADIFTEIASSCGFRADATYVRTGTVKISMITEENSDDFCRLNQEIENKKHPSSPCYARSFPPRGSLGVIENKECPSSVNFVDSNSPCLSSSDSTAKNAPPRESISKV